MKAQGYNVFGDSHTLGDDCHALTLPQQWQRDSLWHNERINLRKPFEIEFTCNLGSSTSGTNDMLKMQDTEKQGFALKIDNLWGNLVLTQIKTTMADGDHSLCQAADHNEGVYNDLMNHTGVNVMRYTTEGTLTIIR
jgi:hypothetical protein